MIHITLIVTDVRLQRLRHFSGTDAIAESDEITGELTMTGPMAKVAPGTYFSSRRLVSSTLERDQRRHRGKPTLDRRLHVHRPSTEPRRNVERGLMTFVKTHERRPPAQSAEYIATHMTRLRAPSNA
ncbi:hypothetical protein [Rhizobium etli]|uniref:Uncharacterized protein n=1 Tax=Rhizobium etli TaxID=29449 RepID=A0A7W6Y5M4_RHIET|nr:hypothetical protein [Rhizobium etli]MBB4478571.1 hypothetical protein [Rhizobium etli]MBB4534403.1 hypothetical protein [Rhizobium etli]